MKTAAPQGQDSGQGQRAGQGQGRPWGRRGSLALSAVGNHPVRAKHGYIQLILTQAVTKLGQPRRRSSRCAGVRPQLPGSPGARNLRHPEQPADDREAPPAPLSGSRKLAAPISRTSAAQIAQRSLTIEANANAEGHLYGSVDADQIAAALPAGGFRSENENVRIEGPLKELGLYSIRIHLAQDIEGEVKLWVVPTHTDE